MGRRDGLGSAMLAGGKSWGPWHGEPQTHLEVSPQPSPPSVIHPHSRDTLGTAPRSHGCCYPKHLRRGKLPSITPAASQVNSH